MGDYAGLALVRGGEWEVLRNLGRASLGGISRCLGKRDYRTNGRIGGLPRKRENELHWKSMGFLFFIFFLIFVFPCSLFLFVSISFRLARPSNFFLSFSFLSYNKITGIMYN